MRTLYLANCPELTLHHRGTQSTKYAGMDLSKSFYRCRIATSNYFVDLQGDAESIFEDISNDLAFISEAYDHESIGHPADRPSYYSITRSLQSSVKPSKP